MAKPNLTPIKDYLKARGAGGIPSPRVAFTEALLEQLPTDATEYVVRDTEQPGLRCRVYPSGAKVLEVSKKPAGGTTTVKVRVCRVGELPLTGQNSVKTRVHAILGQLLAGENPNGSKRPESPQKAASLTLKKALRQYLDEAEIKPSTAGDYGRNIRNWLSDWLDRPLNDITSAMVLQRYRQIKKRYPTAAGNAMRAYRAVHNYHHVLHTDDRTAVSEINPAPMFKLNRLEKGWNNTTRRKGRVRMQDMEAWWSATGQLSDLGRDFLRFVCLTGLRRREASGLTWADVSMKCETISVSDTKNSEPLELPMSDFLMDILRARHKATGGAGRVFPVNEPKSLYERVGQLCGIRRTVHDLRRTFITTAESLDISAYTIKALVNHSSRFQDVTGGYIDIDTDRLREPMQRITDEILRAAGLREAKVVTLQRGVA